MDGRGQEGADQVVLGVKHSKHSHEESESSPRRIAVLDLGLDKSRNRNRLSGDPRCFRASHSSEADLPSVMVIDLVWGAVAGSLQRRKLTV